MAGLVIIGFGVLLVAVFGWLRPQSSLPVSNSRQALQAGGAGLALIVAGSVLAPSPTPADGIVASEVAAAVTTAAPVTTTTTSTTTTTTVAPTTTTTTSTTTTAAPAAALDATLVSVTDGDTIRVRLPDGTEEPVRLIGIDAPEPGAPGAAEAGELLASLLASGPLRLERDRSDRDRFDRLLRYVYVGDVFVNEKLVRAGLAVAVRYPPDTAMAARLERAQEQAQAGRRGLWGTTTTTSTTTTSTTTTPTTSTTTTTEAPGSDGGGCHPSYEGECVPIDVSDVDCKGGSGDGPYYVGRVRVVGPDVYGLDRDGDGIGCE